jgi:hypothetical protein
MNLPTLDELKLGYEAFQKRERRDAMYKTATFLVCNYWGKPAEMADSLGVLLLTWNQACYRYGSFDFEKLEKFIEDNLVGLGQYRAKNIIDYSSKDDEGITGLFDKLLLALAIAEGKKAGVRSPVAVAKALHLLAPHFFPLWDRKIAEGYGCTYATNPAKQYMAFVGISQSIAQSLLSVCLPPGRTLLKLIDEYNYAKYTRGWV